MYQVEVQVQTLRVPDWISRYCQPERFVPLCSACPQYGKNWACPPGMPQVERIAGAYSFVQVIGLKVLYDEAVRVAALTSPERTEEMRRKTYGAAKKQMLHALLALEAEFPGSMTIMAGGCELCPQCARAEGKLCRHPKEMRFSYKANVNALYQKSLRENPQFASNPISRWQQKQAIKKEYAAAKRAGQTAGNTASAAQKTGKAAKTVKEKAQEAGAFVMRHKKGFLIAGAIFLLVCMLLNTMSSCSMMAQSIGSVVSGTTYPSDDPELVAVEADYAAKETALQAEIDNIESSHPGYDEYRYDLDMIGHDPHELAAYLSAVLQGYTRQSAQAELERVFDAQYELTLTEEVEIRYRTETSTDPVTGETTTEEVPYEYYILNVKLTSKPISSVASELLTPEQLEMYQVYRQTLGNKPLIFGGGSPDTSNSEDLTGVVFVNGTAPAIRPWWT